MGSTCTRTAGRWPPLIETKPTPESWEIFWARLVSARSCTRCSGSVSEVSASVSTGVSAGLALLYTGGLGRSRGSSAPAALMAACTCCSATSIWYSMMNCSVISEAPNDEVDVICLRPGSWPNWRSSGVVTDEAITSGLAPG